MKLANYVPTWRWVLLEPIVEDMKGSLYIPPKAQKATGYKVAKTGPACEIVQPGDYVIVENGPMVELFFEESRLLYNQVLEPRIIGIDRRTDDSTGDTYTSESTLPGGSEQ